MLFARHERKDTISTIRDVVEVVAILLAGLWALYVFVYEQRIKPASEPPSLIFTGSLHRLGGVQNGLIRIGMNATILNNGHTSVSLIATSFAADGLRSSANTVPMTDRSIDGLTTYERDGRISSRTLVYRIVELTRQISPKYSTSFTLAPGQSVPYSAIFVVKSGEFDTIALYGSLAYTKNDIQGGYPTKIQYTPTNAVFFDSTNGNPDYYSQEITLDQVSL
jgi:hypothetical protein